MPRNAAKGRKMPKGGNRPELYGKRGGCSNEQPLYHWKQFVRHIPERQVNPGGGGQNGAGVGEALKTLPVVVAAHAGVAYTAKRHIVISNVHYHIIQAGSSR